MAVYYIIQYKKFRSNVHQYIIYQLLYIQFVQLEDIMWGLQNIQITTAMHVIEVEKKGPPEI
jgi:hypothetical protein